MHLRCISVCESILQEFSFGIEHTFSASVITSGGTMATISSRVDNMILADLCLLEPCLHASLTTHANP